MSRNPRGQGMDFVLFFFCFVFWPADRCSIWLVRKRKSGVGVLENALPLGNKTTTHKSSDASYTHVHFNVCVCVCVHDSREQELAMPEEMTL